MPGFPVPMPFISGGDIAGVIAALGEGVPDWAIGDRVALHPVTREGMMGEEIPGGMAEYVRVPIENLIRLPPDLDLVVAAAVPIAYGTAIRMLFEIGRIAPSDLVLVLGYNDRPRVRGKGSAIFVHLARQGFSPTDGCIALSQHDLGMLLTELRRGSSIVVMR